MFSKDDFDESVKGKKTNLKSHSRANLEEIKRAAPHMDVLTGTEEWDRYLTYLQALLDSIKLNIERSKAVMLNPDTWDTESLTREKMTLLKFEDRKELLEFVMGLPKELIETGAIAEQQLYDLHIEESTS